MLERADAGVYTIRLLTATASTGVPRLSANRGVTSTVHVFASYASHDTAATCSQLTLGPARSHPGCGGKVRVIGMLTRHGEDLDTM